MLRRGQHLCRAAPNEPKKSFLRKLIRFRARDRVSVKIPHQPGILLLIEADDQIIVIGRMGSIATRVGIISHGIRSPPDEPTVPM